MCWCVLLGTQPQAQRTERERSDKRKIHRRRESIFTLINVGISTESCGILYTRLILLPSVDVNVDVYLQGRKQHQALFYLSDMISMEWMEWWWLQIYCVRTLLPITRTHWLEDAYRQVDLVMVPSTRLRSALERMIQTEIGMGILNRLKSSTSSAGWDQARYVCVC